MQDLRRVEFIYAADGEPNYTSQNVRITSLDWQAAIFVKRSLSSRHHLTFRMFVGLFAGDTIKLECSLETVVCHASHSMYRLEKQACEYVHLEQQSIVAQNRGLFLCSVTEPRLKG